MLKMNVTPLGPQLIYIYIYIYIYIKQKHTAYTVKVKMCAVTITPFHMRLLEVCTFLTIVSVDQSTVLLGERNLLSKFSAMDTLHEL
jgi:hypothetical protein